MKIRKLFHWLYAILMMLPVFYIGGRVLYTIFNKNAKDSYSGDTTYQINYKYHSNEVNDIDDLLMGNIYAFYTNGLALDDLVGANNYIEFKLLSDLTFPSNAFLIDDSNSEFGVFKKDYILQIWSSDDTQYIDIFYSSQQYDDYSASITYTMRTNTNFTSDCIIQILDCYLDSNLFNKFGYTDYNDIESVNIDTSGTLDNAFIYSVNKLNDEPLFSWATTSFLNQPFTYISGLFGIAASNPIITMLSYWLSISITWLVFDLVMYVPLLVHRWIDKGGIE